MRTKFTQISESEVTVELDDNIWPNARMTWHIWAPSNGGYVRFADGSQVCDRLSSRGNTLIWSGKSPLINLVRREYKAMQRNDKKYY